MKSILPPTRCSALFAAALLVALFIQSSAGGASYRVAHTRDGFVSFDAWVINNSGVVAFAAGKTGGAGILRTVYKGGGGGLRALLEVQFSPPSADPFLYIPRDIALNNAGLVASTGQRGFDGLWSLLCGTANLTNSGAIEFGGSLGLNDSKYVHAGRTLLALEEKIFPCVNCSGILLNQRNQLLSRTGAPEFNLLRIDVAVVSHPLDPPNPAFRRFEPVRTNVVVTRSAQGAGGNIAMNDSGMVAFFDVKPDGTKGIYKSSGSTVVTVVETRPDDPRAEFFFFSPLAINNNGQVAFLASSRTLGKTAFFRGPHPLLDKIVAEGDLVAGSRVGSFAAAESGKSVEHRWFNDSGQIVFHAFDETGDGLWVTGGVASPPPQNPTPTSAYEWVGPGNPPPGTPPNGSFGEVDGWKPLNGATPRVPEKTSTHADIAIFDRAEAYSVELGTQHAERLVVRNGNVVLNGGAIKVDALSFDEPSVIIDNARLTLSSSILPVGPVLTCNHALIGGSGPARVDVVSPAEWLANGSLRVGGPGEGILTIDDGVVTSGESRIGGAGGGHAAVFGNGRWTTGSLAIGIDGGRGELTIAEGGTVESEEALIGQQPGLGNKVTVQGNITSPSRWNVLILGVGGAGTGQIEVTDGALLEVITARVAQEPGATGSVAVRGVNTNGAVSKMTAYVLVIGEKGVGDLSIEDGGLVRVFDHALVGTEHGVGTVTVNGFDAATGERSTLKLSDNAGRGILQVGDTSAGGTLLIEGGALVEVNEFTIVASQLGYTPSEIKIVGAASELDAGELFVTGDASFVTLLGGVVTAPRGVGVTDFGTIRGFGTLDVPTSHRFTNNNGTISPGLSPGTIVIRGSYEQRANGRLLIEFGGTNFADYDHLIITNAASLDGNVTFKFINGFAPKTGDQFDFLNVGGEMSGAFASVGLQNLAPGFQFNVTTNGPLLGMTALNDGVFSTALPGQVQISVTNVGGIAYATYLITTSNTCQTIALEGALTRTNNSFSQAFEGTTFIRDDCVAEIANVTGTLILGALPPGDYSFQILSVTQVVDTIAFTVPPDLGKSLLAPTRLVDGSLQFQLVGLAGVPYTIQASEDLRSWIPIGSGTLPDTFSDPDAAIFPTRYYRARIGR